MANSSDTQNPDRAVTVTGFAGGQTISNRYRLVRVLGQGGMGVVWLARDEKLDRDVALKFLPDIVVNDRVSLNDLIRETRRSLELTHPNIVRTYDFVQDNAVACISMEYVDSDTLRSLRVDQPNGVFEPSRVGEWTGQLCSALYYAHSQAAIVHRDLKPANLMINGRNHLKVADFGIARSLVESVSHMTQQGSTSGTLVYMSPQQLTGDPPSAQDDIYSLGTTLYELFTTRPPFYSGDIAGQVWKKIAPSVAVRRTSLGIPVADFPANWEETIAACLAKDPAQRPQSAAEVAARLGLLDAASVSAVGPSRVIAPGGPVTVSALASPPTAPLYPTSTGPLTGGGPPVFANPARRNILIATGVAAFAILLGLVGLLIHVNRKQEERRQELAHEGQVRQEQDRARQEQERARQEQDRIAAERLASARGSLLVKTEPPGATVRLGNRPPVKTPFSFDDLELGNLTYQIELDGFDPVDGSAQIEENKVAQPGIVTLVPSKGALQIHSQPEPLAYEIKSRANPFGATLTGNTPYIGSALPVGEYEITVRRDGWPPQKQTAAVNRQHEENKLFEFPAGSLKFDSDPAGATVRINDKQVGVTPCLVSDLPPGPVKYTLELAGYDKGAMTGTVAPGQEVPVQVPMKKTVATHTASTHRKSSSGQSGNGDNGNSHSGFDWSSLIRNAPAPGGGPRFPGPHF